MKQTKINKLITPAIKIGGCIISLNFKMVAHLQLIDNLSVNTRLIRRFLFVVLFIYRVRDFTVV